MCRKRRAGEPGPSCASSLAPSSSPAPSSAPSPPSADASSGVRFGIQDDAWLVHGPGTLDDRLDRLERLGVDLVRFNLHWDRIEAVRGEPDWEESDLVLKGLREPRHRRRRRPRRLAALGERRAGRRTSRRARHRSPPSRATAATRYRWVRQWLVWNEPNQARWLRPTTAAVYVRQILNPAYAAIHAVNPAREGRGRRHRAARLDRRRLAGRLDPRDARRRSASRRLRAPSVSRRAPARRRSRAAAATARRSRWRRSSGS